MKLSLGKIVTCVAIVLGLVGALLIFAPAIVPNSDMKELLGDAAKEANLAGSSAAFGNKDDSTVASLYILAFILPLVGVVLSVIALLGKGGKIVPIIAAVCFVVGGIFYFLPMSLVTPDLGDLDGEAKKEALKIFREALKETMTIGAGAIFGGILSILAGVASAATLVLKKD